VVDYREVYVDPFDPLQLWDLTGEEIDNLERALRADSCKLQFVGHYQTGQLDWNGDWKLQFNSEVPRRRSRLMRWLLRFDGYRRTESRADRVLSVSLWQTRRDSVSLPQNSHRFGTCLARRSVENVPKYQL
jgi:hypothetical protein